jgi:hypothetical protein
VFLIFFFVTLHIQDCLEFCVILCDVCYCVVLYCIVLYCPVLHCSTLPPGKNPLAVNKNNNIIITIIIITTTHKAQGHASTVTGLQQAPHLLLTTVTHSLPTVTRNVRAISGRWEKDLLIRKM